MSGNETTPAAPASAPSMVVVNGQSMYLNAEKKLNVPGTFGPNVFLMGVSPPQFPALDPPLPCASIEGYLGLLHVAF